MKTIKQEPGKKRKAQQLVASTETPKLVVVIKGRKRRRARFNVENVAPNSKKHISSSPGSRQTTLSEFFKSPPKQPALACEPTDAAAVQKMVNVPQLLKQLLRARVVLRRIPTAEIPTTPTQTPTIIAGMTDGRRGTAIVQRYCHKCKSFELERTNLTKRKLCRRCGTLLIYVCTKCNVRHFIENRHMKKHFSLCDGEVRYSRGYSEKDALDSVVLRFCADCCFKTTYENVMVRHVKSTGHKMTDEERFVEADTVHGKAEELQSAQARFIVKRSKISSGKRIKRYCPKCKKVVASSRTIDGTTCATCDTGLLYRCGKCQFKRDIYRFVYYHVRTKCYPTVYQCPKCRHTAPFWHSMYEHLKSRQCGVQIHVPRRKYKNSKS